MRAMVQRDHGAHQLALEHREPVPPAPGEVRIEVSHCGLNHLDLWLRRGQTGDKLSLPRVPGSDVLGRVVEVGEGVNDLAEGAPVLLYPGDACGACAACEDGVESACRSFGVRGYNFDGGYVEQVTAHRRNVVPLPDADERWAAVPVSYITAWNGLVAKAGLRAGESVAIWGASGGLGHAALRIATALECEVIAIVGSSQKETWLREHGFDGDVVLRDDDVVRAVRCRTGNRGVDVVLDHVGAASWMTSLKMLAVRGRLAFCGVTTGHRAETDLRHLFGKQLTVHGSWMGDRRDLAEVVALLEKHPDALPIIDEVFALEAAYAAQEHLESEGHVGKTLLRMA
jgi:NADPH:quinone reductase-like Zn-dependent oxidoreductase